MALARASILHLSCESEHQACKAPRSDDNVAEIEEHACPKSEPQVEVLDPVSQLGARTPQIAQKQQGKSVLQRSKEDASSKRRQRSESK